MTTQNTDAVVALQNALDRALDSINLLFFHSRALRAWGVAEIGRAEHMEWIGKMQRAETLVTRLTAIGGLPRSRGAVDLDLGGDVAGVLTANLTLAERMVDDLDGAIAASRGDKTTAAELMECRDAELAHAARLRGWLEGPEAKTSPTNAKHLMPKDGGKAAIEAINRVLPALTDGVSQCFYHSLIFDSWNQQALGERELNAALDKMYRSEALLERLLDLNGVPDGHGIGEIRIGTNEAEIDRLSLDAQQGLPDLIAVARDLVSPGVDPATYILIDGIMRGEEADVIARQARVT